MIEKIFIPTVNRVHNQITYGNLPKKLKKRVVFVVQQWERQKYEYDAEYMILPSDITTNHPRPLSETKQLIYEAGKGMKYALLDDDLNFGRRNAKYWTGISNMEKSKRTCEPSDVLEMFDLYEKWLDEPDVSVCGCAQSENPPSNKLYTSNTSLSSALWINGNDFAGILSELELTKTRVAQDVVFLLSLLTRGYGNRVSNDFVLVNQSNSNKSMKSTIWDNQTYANTQKDHQTIEKMFPSIFRILYDEDGNRTEGGFRGYGKSRIYWNRAYRLSQQTGRVPKVNLQTNIGESTKYENFVDETSGLTKSSPPPPPRGAKKPYPHSLKVHIRKASDAQKFAKLIQRTIRADRKTFVFTETSRFKPENWKFVAAKKNTKKKQGKKRREPTDDLWVGMPDFNQPNDPAYITFTVRFNNRKQLVAFARRVQQRKRISLLTKSIWYPTLEADDRLKSIWVSKAKNKNPKYPVYIVSKGRGDSRYTARALERMGVPYYIAIEPQDYDAYAYVIDESLGTILELPFSNHGDGPGRARNWCWDHAKSLGAKRHWVLDDNIEAFYRLHENTRIKVADGAIFRAAEDFVDRFTNVPVAGLNYRYFVAPRQEYQPFVLNCRIYSCLLIDNKCSYRWRGRYNEDTDQSLRVLKDGLCTIQFNAFLQGKMGTQSIGGGNTEEFYETEGTWNKSRMLEAMHPDVTSVVWRYGRWHHHVDYEPYKSNALIPRKGAKIPSGDPYEMTLISDPK